MKEALAIPQENLQQVISEQFDIIVQQLDFIPIGENSWLYKAVASDGLLLAVKVQRDNNPAVDEARRCLVKSDYPYVPLLHLTNDGKAQTTMSNFHVSVENYIEHDDVKAHDTLPSQNYLVTLGKALYDLHGTEFKVDSAGPIPVDSFQSLYLAPAQTTLDNFTNWSADKPQAQMIQNILTDKASTIKALFTRSIELGAKLAAKQPRLVLTHGDVHFGNTLETRDGRLYIIDWDSTMIAGPGHDLMYFDDAQLADISIGYGSDLLANQDDLQYYRNHLMVRAVWFWLNKAMSDPNNENMSAVTGTITALFNDSDYLLRALGRR